MWSEPTTAWKVWSPDFLADEMDPERAASPWAGHRDFVYDLIRWRQPGVTVELGTEYGCSFFAILQALQDANAEGLLCGIDTWLGSPDSFEPELGPTIFERFSESLEGITEERGQAAPVIEVHRETFCEALERFEEESVDLLHIDGCHAREAVKDDFESWLPKLAPNGMVLLHDVSPESGLGSAAYYKEEVEDDYPGFAFSHNFGLGVVFPKGVEGWDYLFSEEFVRWRESYRFQAEGRWGGIASRDLTRLVEERDQAVTAQGNLIDEQGRTIEGLEWELASREELLGVLVQEKDRAEARLAGLENSPKQQIKALMRSVPRSLERRLRIRARLLRVKHVLRPRTRLREFRAQRQKEQEKSGGDERSPDHPGRVGFREVPRSLSLKALITEASSAGEGITVENFLDVLARGGDPSRLLESQVACRRQLAPREEPEAGTRQFHLHENGRREAGDLSGLIDQAGPQLVSVDVWNTLIGRNRPADAAKTATGRRICLLAPRLPGATGMDPFEVADLRQEIEAEMSSADPVEEYELTAVLAELLTRLGHSGGRDLASLVKDLAEAEVQDEIEWSHTLEDVHGWVRTGDAETVLLSDFYMTREHLGTIVREVTGLETDLVVSVDAGASKRLEGGLFEQVRTERAVPAELHLHIGDHPEADIENQTAGGGFAVHVPPPDDFPAPGEFSKDDLSPCWTVLERELDALAAVEADEFRTAGIELSPLPVLLVARAIEEAHLRAIDRVHYLSREGSFLARIHEVVEPLLRPPQAEEIGSIHLPLSRRSTFGASLEEPFSESMLRLWTMYPNQSVEAMLVSIGLDPEICSEALDRAGLTAENELRHAPSDPRIEALFGDEGFQSLLREHVASQRAALRRFLGERTDLDGGEFLVVDIGWRGTIQDNLVRALGIRSSTGFYLGLFPFLNAQPEGSRKEGVAFDANRGDDFAFAEPPGPIERAWTPDVPSMIGFDLSGGGPEPIWQGEQGTTSPGIGRFQEGTLLAAPAVAGWLSGMGFTSALLKDELLSRSRAAWLDPPPGLGDIWFGSDHDDTFGGLSQITYEKLLPDNTWLEGSLRSHLRHGEEMSGWPAGYRVWAPIRGIIEMQGIARNAQRSGDA